MNDTIIFTSYTEAYAVLRTISDAFKQGGPGDIDSLVDKFKQARSAYAFCRQRLDAIQVEIEAEIARTNGR
jgi:hypothetical protein